MANEFGAPQRRVGRDILVPIPPASLPLPPAPIPIIHQPVDLEAAAPEPRRHLTVVDALLPVAMVALLLVAFSLFWGA